MPACAGQNQSLQGDFVMVAAVSTLGEAFDSAQPDGSYSDRF
jgi:hypothetical protein